MSEANHPGGIPVSGSPLFLFQGGNMIVECRDGVARKFRAVFHDYNAVSGGPGAFPMDSFKCDECEAGINASRPKDLFEKLFSHVCAK
jgi:hypothetical protein